jgi:asparagine synthase (glutamine-hydrolysing)
MSAIFGIVHFNGTPVAPIDLEAMQAGLTRHGADGGALWQAGAAGLGQRLMRFTPQDTFERQPLVSDNGALVVVSDARLDNRDELLNVERLGRDEEPRHPRDSGSLVPDSRLILYAFQKWGVACVHHLAGVFAFAIWDRNTRTLFAARSPIVAPTLVYAATGATFAFATMPSGLHALPFIPRMLNERALANLLVEVGGRPQDTLYRDILALPTGHRLVASREKVEVECFWRPDLTREIRLGGDEAYLAAFHALFTRVVGDHLASATPVALQMSGGLDSSAVAAVATRLLAERGERLAAFTEVPHAGFAGALPKGGYADETPFVQAIAAMHPTLDLHLLRTDGQTFLRDLDSLFAHLEAPFRNTSNRVWIEAILGEAGRRGMRVLLDGMQGNLTLSWNGAGLLRSLARSGRWGAFVQELESVAKTRGGGQALRSFVGQGILPLLPAGAWQTLDRLRQPEGRGAQSWLKTSAINPAFAALHGAPAHDRLPRTTDMRQLRWEALATQDFGAYLSAYRAMYGVDMRSPTADVRLAEFCLALPEEQFRRNGESRSLIRRAMAGVLPPVVLNNRRRGMQAADWFDRLAGAHALVGGELARLEKSELAQRVLDLSRMRQLYERLPAGVSAPADDGYQAVLERGLMVGRWLTWFEAGAG